MNIEHRMSNIETLKFDMMMFDIVIVTELSEAASVTIVINLQDVLEAV